jgi:hypothetical protein
VTKGLRLGATSAAILAAGIALWAVASPRSVPAPSPAETAEPEAPPSAALPPPAAGLAARNTPPPPPKPTDGGGGPAARDTPAPTGPRRVVRFEGVPLAQAKVVLWGGDAPPRVVPLAADGSFAKTADSWALVVPGHAIPTASEATSDAPGADTTYVVSNPATVLRGIVVEQQSGRPVPDLDLHLHVHQRVRHGVDARDLELAESVPAARLRAIARTGPDGRFEVLGLLASESYDVLPASGLWFSTSDREVRVSPRELRVPLVPGFRVSARVLADESGDPLPVFQPRLTWGPGSALGFDGKAGAFTMTLPWWGDGPSFEVVATAAAPEREPAKATAWIDRARPTASVELRLRRLLPAAKAGVVFDIVTASAEFAAQPFDLELREPPGDGAIHQRMPTERVDATRVRATVPAGKWHLRLRPVDVSRHPPDWKGVVDLPEGHETPVRWLVPK